MGNELTARIRFSENILHQCWRLGRPHLQALDLAVPRPHHPRYHRLQRQLLDTGSDQAQSFCSGARDGISSSHAYKPADECGAGCHRVKTGPSNMKRGGECLRIVHAVVKYV